MQAALLPGANPEASNDIPICVGILPLEIFQQPRALTHKFQQPVTGVIILLVNLKMLGKFIDARRQ